MAWSNANAGYLRAKHVAKGSLTKPSDCIAAWTSFMFLYIYVDYFHLYKPGVIDDVRAGVATPTTTKKAKTK